MCAPTLLAAPAPGGVDLVSAPAFPALLPPLVFPPFASGVSFPPVLTRARTHARPLTPNFNGVTGHTAYGGIALVKRVHPPPPARTREHPVLMGWPDTPLMVTIPAQEPLTLTLSG